MYKRQEYDYIVDTMDVPEDKIALIILAGKYHIPVISCMDTGKCVNPSAFQAGDIFSIHQGASARGLSDMLYSHCLLYTSGLRWSMPPIRGYGCRGRRQR